MFFCTNHLLDFLVHYNLLFFFSFKQSSIILIISRFKVMAKTQQAAFMEVVPPQFISVIKHRLKKMLDTIKEDEAYNVSVIKPYDHLLRAR